MADELFPAQPGIDVTPNPSPELKADLTSRWNDWLSAPENRAALMQFGVSLMQPISVGQSVAGHVGQALGGAAEAQTRNVNDQEELAASRRKEKRADTALGLEAEDVKSRRISAKKGFLISPYQAAGLEDKDSRLQLDALKAAAEAELDPQGPAHRALAQFVQQIQGQTSPEGVAPSASTEYPDAQVDPQSGRRYVIRNGKVYFLREGSDGATP